MTISFQGNSFKTRTVFLPEFGSVLISTTKLNDKLLNKNGSYTSEESVMVDEKIFYFVDEDKIKLPYMLLKKILINEIV